MTEPAAATPPRASVVIVAKRDRPMLRTCLERLAALSSATSFETIVVFNGCPPEEAAQFEHECSDRVRMISCAVNLGLAGALNRARALASGEYIASLHDDAEPAAGWLDALVAAADQTDAGAVGSLVLNHDGSVQAAGWELLGDGWTRPPWTGTPPPSSAFDRRVAVDYCPSCSLLVRTSSWDRAGGADERYFPLVYVDVDLCLALRARGEQVLFEPSSLVMHHRGSSSTPDYVRFVWHRNRALLVDKWRALLDEQVPGRGQTWSLPDAAIPRQDRQTDDAARERAQLIREVATVEAFAAHLRGQLAAATEDRDQTRVELDSARGELERGRIELDHTVERLAAVEAQLPWLQMRAETLARIEAGGWWRLRTRLRPALRLYSAARRMIRRV